MKTVCCLPKVVCVLEGFKITTLVCCLYSRFDYLVKSQLFLRAGCNSWKIVNYYKHFVLISLSLLFLKLLSCFAKTTG